MKEVIIFFNGTRGDLEAQVPFGYEYTHHIDIDYDPKWGYIATLTPCKGEEVKGWELLDMMLEDAWSSAPWIDRAYYSELC